MPAFRAFAALLLFASVGVAADLAKLRTLDGKLYEGELVGLADKHIDFRGKEGPVQVPLANVLDLDLPHGAGESAGKYSDVTLTDGSLFHCTQVVFKKADVELKLVTGQDVKVPLAAIANVLFEAQDAAAREEWQKHLAKQGSVDVIAVKRGGSVNILEGTLGHADEAGEKIDFELKSIGKPRPIAISGLHGLSFFRKSDVGPDPLCKVHDAGKNLLMAKQVAKTGDGFTVTTLAGAKVEYGPQLVAKLDFSKGKLTFLSDLEPVKVTESSLLEGIDHYRRDKNLDGGPIQIKNTKYSKGLALHAYSELVYDIAGAYKDFKAVLGVDDQVGGDSRVKVTIEGDDRELKTVELTRKDGPVEIALNVKNVKQLKITVRSVGLLDLGNHVDVADAKVSK